MKPSSPRLVWALVQACRPGPQTGRHEGFLDYPDVYLGLYPKQFAQRMQAQKKVHFHSLQQKLPVQKYPGYQKERVAQKIYFGKIGPFA